MVAFHHQVEVSGAGQNVVAVVDQSREADLRGQRLQRLDERFDDDRLDRTRQQHAVEACGVNHCAVRADRQITQHSRQQMRDVHDRASGGGHHHDAGIAGRGQRPKRAWRDGLVWLEQRAIKVCHDHPDVHGGSPSQGLPPTLAPRP